MKLKIIIGSLSIFLLFFSGSNSQDSGTYNDEVTNRILSDTLQSLQRDVLYKQHTIIVKLKNY